MLSGYSKLSILLESTVVIKPLIIDVKHNRCFVMSDLFFVFNSHFDRDRGLDNGRLSLNSLSEGTKRIWVAASSHRTGQGKEAFHNRGGLLPPQYRVPSLKNWEVDLRPIPMPLVRGIRGNFYKILPYSVTTDKGGFRGDFGIHQDADAEGSLGCIVMTRDRFVNFEDYIKAISENYGVKKLPLFVFYS